MTLQEKPPLVVQVAERLAQLKHNSSLPHIAIYSPEDAETIRDEARAILTLIRDAQAEGKLTSVEMQEAAHRVTIHGKPLAIVDAAGVLIGWEIIEAQLAKSLSLLEVR